MQHCQACGVEAETREVTFHQNVGVIILRFSNTVSGHLCKSCISRYFWSMTTISMLFGWWGIISFIINPFIILLNLIRYFGSVDVAPPGQAPARQERSEMAEAPRSPAPQASASADGCYLCGRPLRPEEKGARVCRDCS